MCESVSDEVEFTSLRNDVQEWTGTIRVNYNIVADKGGLDEWLISTVY